MPKFFSLILSAVVLLVTTSSCTKYIQIITTKSNDCELLKEGFVYENDTLKITYGFWAEHGIMGFVIYNKTNRPLYVDWRKSAFINDGVKLNYWNDKVTQNSISLYNGYFYRGPQSGYWSNYTSGTGRTLTTISKEERITFLPPETNFFRGQFFIMPNTVFNLDGRTLVSTVPRNDNPSKSTKIYSEEFNRSQTPGIFRNFMTFSFNEDFKEEFYVDNEFYISGILRVEQDHFEYRKTGNYEKDGNGNYIMVYPFKSQSSFFVRE